MKHSISGFANCRVLKKNEQIFFGLQLRVQQVKRAERDLPDGKPFVNVSDVRAKIENAQHTVILYIDRRKEFYQLEKKN
ncbi:Nuclease SbcCD subunit [Trichinella spiralis]|uniref:Nuclease SbcCD subunit n=1 Tax=Trichinella spiralis TaxID=6334 RepID=A0ABR3KJI3_TRISP